MLEIQLQRIIAAIQDLLSCNDVALVLECNIQTLCHPLLTLLPHTISSSHQYYGTPLFQQLFAHEGIRAYRDIALHTGRHLAYRLTDGWLYSTPLERPTGILGQLCCFTYENATTQPQDTLTLLTRAQPTIALQVERVLHNLYIWHTTAQGHDQSIPTVALVGHELRVPLTAIKGYAGLLQLYGSAQAAHDAIKLLSPERQQYYIDSIVEQATVMEMLLKDLSDLSYLQTEQLPLRATDVNVAQECHSVIRIMQDQLAHTRPQPLPSPAYQLRCHIEEHLPRIWADPYRLRQVLTNLLENAIKYSPEGGFIDILASTSSMVYAVDGCHSGHGLESHTTTPVGLQAISSRSLVHITIRDQGVGIPYQHQASLFSLFTRVRQPTTEHVPGMGVGLYLTQKLVEAMHGHITLQSNEGQGTSITLTFPTMSEEHS